MSRNTKMALILGSIVLTLLILIPLVWKVSGEGYMMSPGMMGGFGWGWFMPIFMILFWVLIIWVVVTILTGASSSSSTDSSSRIRSPLEVLKERYARGEISKEEYEEKKRELV